VRRAERAGRIGRETDGAWDLAKVRAAWAGNTDPAQQRSAQGGTPAMKRRALKPVPDAAVGAVRETLREHGEPEVVSHGRYVAFQMAEVAVPRALLAKILRLIAELRPRSPPIPA
jgi:hypothetical protein